MNFRGALFFFSVLNTAKRLLLADFRYVTTTIRSSLHRRHKYTRRALEDWRTRGNSNGPDQKILRDDLVLVRPP
jgi:hypothetical protein